MLMLRLNLMPMTRTVMSGRPSSSSRRDCRWRRHSHCPTLTVRCTLCDKSSVRRRRMSVSSTCARLLHSYPIFGHRMQSTDSQHSKRGLPEKGGQREEEVQHSRGKRGCIRIHSLLALGQDLFALARPLVQPSS